ncbi:MAG: hypothetical protein ACTSWX_03105 [Promethearchaeota archaeon]
MIPEDGYNYGNLVIIMLFFAGFTLFGVLLMVLDFIIIRKKQNQKEIQMKQSISTLKLTGIVFAICGLLGLFISFCYLV